jgi:anti-sigma-K factor RskA
MIPTEPAALDALAAEYVLGTLSAREAEAVRDALPANPALAEAVAAWEARLAPLAALAPPEPPPEGLWARIERSLDGEARGATDAEPGGAAGMPSGAQPAERPGAPPADNPGAPPADNPGAPPARHPGAPPARDPGAPPARDPGAPPADNPGAPPADNPGAPPADNPGAPPARHPGAPPARDPGAPPARRWRDPWRWGAVGATAIAASLALLLVARPPEPPRLMTVLLTSQQDSAWIVEADGRRIRLAALNPRPAPSDRVLQLWALPQGATAPTSLGLIPAEGRIELRPTTIRPEPGMLIEITLEPPGGSPTGRPTGPIQFIGRLAPAAGS